MIIIALDATPGLPEAHPDAPIRRASRPRDCARCGGLIRSDGARNGAAHLDCGRPHMTAIEARAALAHKETT